jgi:hypothetical protein
MNIFLFSWFFWCDGLNSGPWVAGQVFFDFGHNSSPHNQELQKVRDLMVFTDY